MPISILEYTAAWAGPPQNRPNTAKEMFTKNSPAPMKARTEPKITKRKMKLAAVLRALPNRPSSPTIR